MVKTPAITLRSLRGFTLIELMVGISVLAILLAVGIPSFTSIINNNRVATGSSQLVAALNYARSEAIKRGDSVTVCSSADKITCDAATAWANDWIAFTDTPAQGTVNGDDKVLQVWPAVAGGLTLTGTRNLIQYTSSGMPNPIPSGTPPQESFLLLKPGCSGDKARQIVVTLSGRIGSTVKSCT